MPPDYPPADNPEDLRQEVGIEFPDPTRLPSLQATVDAHNHWTIVRWGEWAGSEAPAMGCWLQTQVAAYSADRNRDYLFQPNEVPDASIMSAAMAVRAFPGSRWLNKPPRQFGAPLVEY